MGHDASEKALFGGGGAQMGGVEPGEREKAGEPFGFGGEKAERRNCNGLGFFTAALARLCGGGNSQDDGSIKLNLPQPIWREFSFRQFISHRLRAIGCDGFGRRWFSAERNEEDGFDR